MSWLDRLLNLLIQAEVNKMDTIQSQISLYHTLFYVCLALMIIFIICAVLFFFLFDIRRIIAYMFGFSEKEAAQKMEKANVGGRTGGLKSGRIDMEYTTSNLDKYAPNGEVENLNIGSEETSKLAPSMPANQAKEPAQVSKEILQPTMAPAGPVLPIGFHFTITENIMVIHTNELI